MKVTGIRKDPDATRVLALPSHLPLEQVQAMLCNADEYLVGLAHEDTGTAIWLRSEGISMAHWLEALATGLDYLAQQETET